MATCVIRFFVCLRSRTLSKLVLPAHARAVEVVEYKTSWPGFGCRNLVAARGVNLHFGAEQGAKGKRYGELRMTP